MKKFCTRCASLFSNHYTLLIVLLFLAVATRFFAFGYPDQIVFDEFHFAQFTDRYFDGKYYFDIHPPLAKLVMAGAALIAGHEPNTSFTFTKIGQQYTDNSYKAYRAAVSVAGVLLVLAMYAFSYQLFKKKSVAFFSGLLVIFDNALLTQSRLALMDIFLLLFGIAGLWILWLARTRERKWSKIALYVVAGVLVGCAASVKMTGVFFIGLAGVVVLADIIARKGKRLIMLGLGTLLALCAVGVYMFWCWLHLALLPLSGTGDVYMTGPFRATLVGNEYYHTNDFVPQNMLYKIVELNEKMFTYNRDLAAPHTESSAWYQWPFGIKPIYYWLGPFGTPRTPTMYLHGNEIIWYAGVGAFFWALLWFVIKTTREKRMTTEAWAVLFLMFGYWVNLLAYTAIARVAFLYHYFPSLLCLVILLAWMLGKWFLKYPIVVVFFFLIVVWQFIQLATITYGI